MIQKLSPLRLLSKDTKKKRQTAWKATGSVANLRTKKPRSKRTVAIIHSRGLFFVLFTLSVTVLFIGALFLAFSVFLFYYDNGCSGSSPVMRRMVRVLRIFVPAFVLAIVFLYDNRLIVVNDRCLSGAGKRKSSNDDQVEKVLHITLIRSSLCHRFRPGS